MRIPFKMLVMVLILLVAAPTLYAQCYPGIGIDSSFRVEYLLGALTNRYEQPQGAFQVPAVQIPTNLIVPPDIPVFEVVPSHPAAFDKVQTDINPQVAVLTGMVEISPIPAASGRLAGSISVFERSGHIFRPSHHESSLPGSPGPGVTWEGTPNFSQWEVGGLYHLWNAAGYRFSITAGYRQETWTFTGQPVGFAHGSLSDKLSSSIPFIGMQTSMLFPWWKARFEVLGSPFMSKRLTNSSSAILNGAPIGVQAEGRANGGGLLEFQMEGSVGLSPSLFLGINACYTFQELYGNSSVTFPAVRPTPFEYRLYTSESMFRVGFDVNYLF